MGVVFTKAIELKQRYRVDGKFYGADLGEERLTDCRSVLEIRRLDSKLDAAPDAVFVMMNPGSSQPLNFGKEVVREDLPLDSAPLVPTRPDTTQYQVMRIMDCRGWQAVRVINLSDLRDAQSGRFIGTMSAFEGAGYSHHSVFCASRAGELARYLSRNPGAPVICAWGVNDGLDPLVRRAQDALAGEPDVTGYAPDSRPGKFYHPLPTRHALKLRWLEKTAEILAGRCV